MMTCDAVGGVWTYVLELARALLPHKVDILLVILGPEPSHIQLVDLRSLVNVKAVTLPYKLEWMDEPWNDLQRAGVCLLSLEKQWRPDLIHLNSFVLAVLPWKAPKLVVAHSCVCSWWRAVNGESAPDRWNRYGSKVQAGLNAAELVVAPTKWMMAALHRNYDWSSKEVLIANGIARDDYFQVAHKRNLIFASGRLWDEAKNTAALERVKHGINWPVLIAGPKAQANSPDVSPAAMKTNGSLPLQDVRSLMSTAAIYVHPAKYEPFGLSVLEAAMSGCALALGDIGSLRELWEDAAIFVNPNDDDQLKAAINLLISQPDHRDHFASRALARSQHFSAEKMARNYLEAYSALTTDRAHTFPAPDRRCRT